jgi:4a-hydroxytetrahydrobiopterin dehydratase
MPEKLSQTYTFPDFLTAMRFVNAVAKLAEEQNHHPDIHIYYNKVTIESWTHTVGGITDKDHQLMEGVDRIKSIPEFTDGGE